MTALGSFTAFPPHSVPGMLCSQNGLVDWGRFFSCLTWQLPLERERQTSGHLIRLSRLQLSMDGSLQALVRAKRIQMAAWLIGHSQ